MPHHERRGQLVQRTMRATPALLRPCPTCGAGPNQSCVRIIAAKVGGEDIGGSYTKRLKKIHPARKGDS